MPSRQHTENTEVCLLNDEREDPLTLRFWQGLWDGLRLRRTVPGGMWRSSPRWRLRSDGLKGRAVSAAQLLPRSPLLVALL